MYHHNICCQYGRKSSAGLPLTFIVLGKTTYKDNISPKIYQSSKTNLDLGSTTAAGNTQIYT
jgi:hypothetical protein